MNKQTKGSSVEELLKPRYKVIAGYPGMIIRDDLSLNEIFSPKEKHGTHFYMGHDVTKYPHLFKLLQWWEERDFDLTGMYIRAGDLDKPHACYQLLERLDHPHMELWRMKGTRYDDHEYDIHNTTPITETEYNDYLKTQKP